MGAVIGQVLCPKAARVLPAALGVDTHSRRLGKADLREQERVAPSVPEGPDQEPWVPAGASPLPGASFCSSNSTPCTPPRPAPPHPLPLLRTLHSSAQPDVVLIGFHCLAPRGRTFSLSVPHGSQSTWGRAWRERTSWSNE